MIKKIVRYAAAILLVLMVCIIAAGPVKEMLAATKNGSTDERVFPEKLDTQDYEKFIIVQQNTPASEAAG